MITPVTFLISHPSDNCSNGGTNATSARPLLDALTPLVSVRAHGGVPSVGPEMSLGIRGCTLHIVVKVFITRSSPLLDGSIHHYFLCGGHILRASLLDETRRGRRNAVFGRVSHLTLRDSVVIHLS